jgi:uncharacterized protein YndB with AHSA1/START domain
MSKTNLQQQITVHALASKVWKVLTHPEYVNQYFLKDSIYTDWIEGSSIFSHSGNEEMRMHVGKVLESVPGMLLKFNLREGNTSNFTTTTYELVMAADGVELKIKCEGFKAAQPEYVLRVQQANLLLQKIKWLSEYS